MAINPLSDDVYLRRSRKRKGDVRGHYFRDQTALFEGAGEAWEVRVGPRRQNPHMHLLEALLALGWRAEADALVRLFHERFYDEKSGSLAELFDERWQPLATPEGRIVEPGHNFEWVWLLHGRSAAPGLFDFAYRHGVDADGGGLTEPDAVRDLGPPGNGFVDGVCGCRCWRHGALPARIGCRMMPEVRIVGWGCGRARIRVPYM